MSDELDRFVLQYQIDSGTAERDLARLNAKVKAMSADSDKSTGSVNDLGAAMRSSKGHGDSFAGALDQVFTKLRNISPGAASATVAMAGLAAIMSQVNKSMREYSEQRELAFRTGSSQTSVETFQRNVSAASHGRVGAESARDIYKTVNELGQAAYTDPTQNSREARLLRNAGGKVNNDQGGIAGVEDNIEAISKAFAKLDESTAQARGALLGFSQDQTTALREMGKQSSQNKAMSDGEAAAHAEALAAALKLQGANASIAESMRQAGNGIADAFLPAMADFETSIANISKAMPGAVQAVTSKLDWLDRFISNLDGKLDYTDSPENHLSVKQAAEKADRDQKAAAEKARTEQAKRNADSRNEIAQTNRDIALFSSAVQTFAGSVDTNRAISAWAGELGRANGLGSKDGVNLGDGPRGKAPMESAQARQSILGETGQPGGNNQPKVSRGVRNFNPGNIEYGPFARATGATGSDGRFAIYPDMQTGIASHTRLIQNYIKDGFDTLNKIIPKYAPSSENDTAGYLASVAKATGIDPNAKITPAQLPSVIREMEVRESGYRGEGVAPKLRPQGDDYTPSAVIRYAQDPDAAPVYSNFERTGMAFRQNDGKGIGRQQLQAEAYFSELAQALGVPIEQLKRGAVNKGDVAYAQSNLFAQHETAMLLADTKMQAPGLTPQQKQELFVQRGSAAARVRDDMNFAGDIAARAQAGPRTALTIGQMPITIQGQDFTPDHVHRVMKEALSSLVNSVSSDKKL